MPVDALSPLPAATLALGVLIIGAYVVAVFEQLVTWAAGPPRASGRTGRASAALVGPLRTAALLWCQRSASTERPDPLLWALAPAVYATVAAVAFTVVPLAEDCAIADVQTGVVVFGAAEALAIVAIFLRGWSPNSYLALLGGYRFVALGLSYELLSMFVLIAAALPAESLQMSALVEAQGPVWNLIRQPLGLPLWIVVTWGVTLSGPLDVADSADLAGGGSLEVGGRPLLLWKVARGGMVTVFCAMGAAVFLGGWQGPVLPGPVWMTLKTAALMLLVVWLAHRVGRWPISRAMSALWTVGLPLSFLHLAWAGLEALS